MRGNKEMRRGLKHPGVYRSRTMDPHDVVNPLWVDRVVVPICMGVIAHNIPADHSTEMKSARMKFHHHGLLIPLFGIEHRHIKQLPMHQRTQGSVNLHEFLLKKCVSPRGRMGTGDEMECVVMERCTAHFNER